MTGFKKVLPAGNKAVIFLVLFFLLAGLPLTVSGFYEGYAKVTPYAQVAKTSYPPAEVLSEGKFLVAGKRLKGSVFSGTVILLIAYGPNGAMGLVTNRPTNVTLAEALPDVKGHEGLRRKVYWGGPVENNRMTLLVRSTVNIEGAGHVFGDIYVSSSRDLLSRMIDEGKGTQALRVFAGYAGWAPKQLEREISMGAWRVLTADEVTVFSVRP